MNFFARIRKPRRHGRDPLGDHAGLKPRIFKVLWILVLAISLVFIAPKKSEAFCVCCCTNMAELLMDSIDNEIIRQHDITEVHIDNEFLQHELWLVEVYYRSFWGEAIAMMTEQMSAVSLYQMNILGALLDAKHQIETQRLFSELGAQAMKDYTPSDSLCTIGSAGRSLGQAELNNNMTKNMMGQWSRDRQLHNANSNSADGPKEDREGRLAQFQRNYCDPNDNNRALTTVCEATVTQERRNKDVDYGYTLGQPWTLDINFGDTVVTDDEADIMALAANLYSHDVFQAGNPEILRDNPKNQQLYLDLRAIVAKRSVAEQSFQAIAGMKTSGASDAAETARYLREIMKQLGIATDAEIDAIIGENPSYYAQMEILTSKLFQTPDFFVDLYEKPANTTRKGVALQALNLMQESDIFNSALRSEQMMSVLLELHLETSQRDVQNKVKRMAQ